MLKLAKIRQSFPSFAIQSPEKELAAWLFIKYYTGTKAQTEWVQATNYYPVRKSVKESLSGSIKLLLTHFFRFLRF